MDIAQLTTFLGWCTVINFAVLIVATVLLWSMRGFAARVHAGMFGLDPDEMPMVYMTYLAHYKILTVVFFLVPYVALKVMQAG